MNFDKQLKNHLSLYWQVITVYGTIILKMITKILFLSIRLLGYFRVRPDKSTLTNIACTRQWCCRRWFLLYMYILLSNNWDLNICFQNAILRSILFRNYSLLVISSTPDWYVNKDIIIRLFHANSSSQIAQW